MPGCERGLCSLSEAMNQLGCDSLGSMEFVTEAMLSVGQRLSIRGKCENRHIGAQRTAQFELKLDPGDS